jgi:hypothetical protein
MAKHLYKILSFLFLTLCLSANSSFGQTKGGSSKSKGSPEVAPQPVERMGVPLENPAAAERAYKVSKETFVFLVMVNQTSESVQALNDLPSQFPGTRVEPLPSGGNLAYVVKSRNPSMAMFQRAFGTTLQIFTEGDLQTYAAFMPAFAQLKEQLTTMSAKLGDL